MKLKHAVLCLSMFALFAISFNASAGEKAKSKKMSNSEKAKMILEKAGKVRHKDHIATGKVLTYEYVRYSKIDKDGVYYLRMDNYRINKGKKQLVSIELIRGGQDWTIIGNYALKNPGRKKAQFKKPNIKNKEIFKVSYKVENEVVNGVKCYVVSEIFEDEPILPKITQRIIREKDFVEIGKREYDKGGKLVGSQDYNITFKKLDDKIFEIPKDKTVKTFKTFKEYSDFESKVRLGVVNELQNEKE